MEIPDGPKLDFSKLLEPKKPDPMKEKLLKLSQKFEGDPTSEIGSKYKQTEEKHPDSFYEGESDGTRIIESLENKIQCKKCSKYVLNVEFQSHLNSHSSQILDWLFLGGERNANNEIELKERDKINVIVNVSEEVPNYFPDDFEYLNYPLLDEVKQDITTIFQEFVDKIAKYKAQEKRVLIHCIQGISRSVSLLLAYLISEEKMTLKEAYEHVKLIRPIAKPNQGFLKQLISFENKIHNENTLTIEDVYPPGTIVFMSLNHDHNF